MLLSSAVVAFSQGPVKIRQITYVDEKLDCVHDTTSIILIDNESFPRYAYRFLLFEIELGQIVDTGAIHVSDFKVFFSASGNTLALQPCCVFYNTIRVSRLHAYCPLQENMIPGGHDFIEKDVYNDFEQLKDSLRNNIKVFYMDRKTNVEYELPLPEINVISPFLPSTQKADIRHALCPCAKYSALQH